MSLSNRLLEKFFRGDCTEEEKQQVLEFFRDHPEILAQYLTEDSWKEFILSSGQANDPGQPGLTDQPGQSALSGKLREAIEARIGPGVLTPSVTTPDTSATIRTTRRIRYASWAAAASVLFVTSLIFLLRRSSGDKPIATAPPQIAVITKKGSVQCHIQNPTEQKKTFFLPDSSRVELAVNSDITFNNPFDNDRRDIFLKGQATFTVTKDTKPFVVHSRDIATTVLGTVFSVNDKKKGFTTVHLSRGKVVVRPEGKTGRRFKDVYLQPGQQLILDEKDFSVHIKDDAALITRILPVAPVRQQVFNFSEKPLTEIFALLQQEYKVTIVYDAAALQNMSFTGRLDRNKESLESFLNTLCDLNELNLKKTSNNSFTIAVK